jgi:hypothetical protein
VVSVVSVASEEKGVRREEEVKRKLKSKPRLPQLEIQRAPAPRIQPAPQVRTGMAASTAEGQTPLKWRMQLKPVAVKAARLAPQGLKGVVGAIGVRSVEPTTPKAIVQAIKGIAMKAELKPKIPMVQPLEVSRSSAAHRLVIRQPREELKASLKPLRPTTLKPEPMRAPTLKPPEVALKPASPALPRPIEEGLIAEGVKGLAKTAREGPSRPPEEEVFVPPLFEEMSSVAKPAGRPVCIVLPKRENDSFVHSIAIVCREIYRIVEKEGRPRPRWISRGLKEEIERDLRAEGMTFVVDDSNREFFPDLGKIQSCKEFLEKVDMGMVLDRLREHFSQGLGFVIFHVNERWAGRFANLLKEEVGAFANIIEVRAPDWHPQAKAAIAGACWGFVEEGGRTFDEMFGRCEKRFFKELERAGEDVEFAHYIRGDEGAGYEHEGMKAIVVECLARELGAKSRDEAIQMLKEGKIETEYDLSNGGRADIYVPSEQRYVEVETFYGTGDPIIDKLDRETLSKYRGRTSRVDVVLLTGVQALLYARRLVKLAGVYRREHGLEVNFYLPHVKERRLVPLKEAFHILRDAIGPSKPIGELATDDVDRLWSEFSRALRERGMDPEEERYKRLFKFMIDRSKSYQDNLSDMLEEVELLRGAERRLKL